MHKKGDATRRGEGDAAQQREKAANEGREPGAGAVSKEEYERIKKEAVKGISG